MAQWHFSDGPVVESLPAVQRTQAGSLVREDATGREATKPVHCNDLSSCSRVCAQRQGKPLQWEAHAPQPGSSLLTATRESPQVATKT